MFTWPPWLYRPCTLPYLVPSLFAGFLASGTSSLPISFSFSSSVPSSIVSTALAPYNAAHPISEVFCGNEKFPISAFSTLGGVPSLDWQEV